MTVKWAYLIFGENWDISGTNDLAVATEAAEYDQVIDVATGLQLGPLTTEDYREVGEYMEPPKEDVDITGEL